MKKVKEYEVFEAEEGIINSIPTVPLKKLKQKSNNPRHITEYDMNVLVVSLIKFFKMLWKRPIVVTTVGDKYEALGGNQRVKGLNTINSILKEFKNSGFIPLFISDADIDLNTVEEVVNVPVIFADDWSEAEKEEFLIRDNVQSGTWNWEALQVSYNPEVLKSYGVDVPVWDVPFEEKEAEEDDFEPPKDIQTNIVSGDVIEIGSHRLVCGDSTDSDAVAKLMNGELYDLLFTDPPYGINYSGGRTERKNNTKKIKNDNLGDVGTKELLSNVFLYGKPTADVYICASPVNLMPFLSFVEDYGKTVDSVIVWDKGNAGLGYMKYRLRCEFILYVKGDWDFHIGDPSDIDLWSINRDSSNSYKHVNQKPVALPYRAIKNSIFDGSIVCDLFGGSGSTMLAAHQLGVSCYVMELDPQFCQLHIDRMLHYDHKIEIKVNGKPYVGVSE